MREAERAKVGVSKEYIIQGGREGERAGRKEGREGGREGVNRINIIPPYVSTHNTSPMSPWLLLFFSTLRVNDTSSNITVGLSGPPTCLADGEKEEGTGVVL